MVLAAPASAIADPILLPELASFAVLGAESVTNTGPTKLTGNLGVSNNPSVTGITGFFGTLLHDGPGTFTGTARQGDVFALLAEAQLVAAITTLNLTGPGELLPSDLASLTLNPGVYTVPAGTTNLSGMLTLDGLGDPNALWVFQMLSTLITSPGSAVNVINAGSGSGLYWNVRSSATHGPGARGAVKGQRIGADDHELNVVGVQQRAELVEVGFQLRATPKKP